MRSHHFIEATMRIAPFIFFFATAFVCGAAPVIDSGADPSRPTVTAALPHDLARQLAPGPLDPARICPLLRFVRLDDTTAAEGPPIFGVYSLTGDTLRFVPDFPLGEGAHYRAVLCVPGLKVQATDYEVRARPAADAPRVVEVYPSAKTLPANLLKFYVHFSQPVRQTDQIFEQIHILDARGQIVPDPWRRFQQWSDDGRRLTLWVHAGRVKQGVNLREDFGPVLQTGRRYTLLIDASVLDLSGRPLAAKFEKPFATAGEDHERLSLEKWTFKLPAAGTRDPLRLTFPKPLDHALMQRLITVRDPSNKPVEGHGEAGDAETTWIFHPDRTWPATGYTLHVDSLLEDLAGNTPAGVFDSDARHPDTQPAVTDLHFTLK